MADIRVPLTITERRALKLKATAVDKSMRQYARDVILDALGIDAVKAMRDEFGDLPLSFRYETWRDFEECAVLNRDASKRTALARLCADFGVSRERVLAIGDSRNDVPMLHWAGIGVAMSNALEEVRQAVVHVTASNDQDGVALAIERFALAGLEKKTA